MANNAVATAQSALPLVENSEQAPQLAASSLALSPLSSPTSRQEQDTIKTPAESTPCQVKPQPRVKGNISVRSKKVSASAARKKAISAYIAWCRDQRLRLPTNLRNAEREKVLGKRWKALPEAERAKWRNSAPAPVPSPSDVDSFYSQTPTTVHAAPPAAPTPSAASITSANKNWLMTILSELDNDVIMDLIQP